MEPGLLLFSLLTAAAPITALVGYTEAGQSKHRIYPVRVPPGKPRPNLTYQVISSGNDGSETCELNDRARVQINLFAESYAEIAALTAAVRAALSNQRVGDYFIAYEGLVDHHDDTAVCLFRSVDFLID